MLKRIRLFGKPLRRIAYPRSQTGI
jgi:hypothetical protein